MPLHQTTTHRTERNYRDQKQQQQNKNALHHGLYSSDFILPSEKAEDFYELLNGVREDLTPQGTIENRIIVDLTHLFWKKARVNRLTQLLIRQTPVAAQIVASGKRTIKGICAHLASPIDENDGFDVSLEQAESLRSTISDENDRGCLRREARGDRGGRKKPLFGDDRIIPKSHRRCTPPEELYGGRP